jgi:hypothetical protein
MIKMKTEVKKDKFGFQTELDTFCNGLDTAAVCGNQEFLFPI